MKVKILWLAIVIAAGVGLALIPVFFLIMHLKGRFSSAKTGDGAATKSSAIGQMTGKLKTMLGLSDEDSDEGEVTSQRAKSLNSAEASRKPHLRKSILHPRSGFPVRTT